MKNFSHIYIEEEAAESPVTKTLLQRFPASNIIPFRNYKEIFNRPKQNFQLQKKSMNLILAHRKEKFLYSGSDMSSDFGNRNFYYNAMILNCVYNCDYCYLQGMFPSGNIVIFVNIEDYISETEKFLESSPLYLCISYDTDLLAFETLVPYTAKWIEFAGKHSNLLLEVRTKSANYKSISHLKPIENVILAWTISPELVTRKYEKNTPTLNRRIQNILSAINDGWKVRICFDPLLLVTDFEKLYSELILKIFSEIPAGRIFDVSIGVFRMNSDFLKKIQKGENESDILYYPFEKQGKIMTYPEEIQEPMRDFIVKRLLEFLPKDKIYN